MRIRKCADKSLALKKTTSYGIEKMYLLYIFLLELDTHTYDFFVLIIILLIINNFPLGLKGIPQLQFHSQDPT
jgi:hypothetical protein